MPELAPGFCKMNINKHKWITVLILLVTNLSGNTLEVGSGQANSFTTIQSAIDTSNSGDTILVWPGIWIENIDYLGKDIVLTSHFMYDHDPQTIRNTVIDGNQSGACVEIKLGETRAAQLNGFTITNGSGHWSGLDSYYGGGLYIYESSPSITNCIIENNSVLGLSNGGGVFLSRGNNPLLSNVTIRENMSGLSGGGISIFETAVEFDSVNRCNIYLNQAAHNNDFWQNDWDSIPIPVYLDTFTVGDPDSYFYRGFFTVFDIQHGLLTPVDHDLYVSPEGDNSNSGLSPEEPLKNIFDAYIRISADTLNPRTIYLLPGVYSGTTNGEYYPLNMRSYVSLIGSGIDTTIISLEGVKSYGFDAGQHEQHYTIANMTMRNLAVDENYTSQMGIAINQNKELLIENMKFIDVSEYAINAHLSTLYWVIDQSSMIIRNCTFTQSENNKALSILAFREAIVENCIFTYNTPYYPPDWYANGGGMRSRGHHYTFLDMPYRRIENCEFTNNFSDNSYVLSGAASIEVEGPNITDIINCTFSDNISTDYANIGINGRKTEVRIINSILFNNAPYEIFIDGRLATEENPLKLILSNNIIQSGEWGIGRTGYWDIEYIDDIIELNPQFNDPGNDDYTLSVNSGAIDAGTALFIWEDDTVLNLSQESYFGSAPDLGAYEYNSVSTRDYSSSIFPDKLAIKSIYPNPFNSQAILQYSVPESGTVEITLIDLNGRQVQHYLKSFIVSGTHSLSLNLESIASGVYFIRISQNHYSDIKTITLLK